MNTVTMIENHHAAFTTQEVQTHKFFKEAERWFIHLPAYLAQGWNKTDLEMAEGTGKLLNTLASGREKITLRMSTEPFDGADVLKLMELCESPGGGAIYMLETCHGREVSTLLWICDIALFVFGDMPPHIYVKRVSGKAKTVNT